MTARHLLFLRDVAWLTLSAFGGPQAHVALFLKIFVEKRRYLTENELMEIHALCQLLPGPSSTQTLTAIAYKKGGGLFALLCLSIWLLPAFGMVTSFALMLVFWQGEEKNINLWAYTQLMQPIAVGLVAHAGWVIVRKLVQTREAVLIMLIAAVAAYFLRTPFLLPVLMVLSGVATSLKYRDFVREEKTAFTVKWKYLILFVVLFVGIAALGGITRLLPIRLLENFYRNGALVFGGGQVLVPVLYNEFVAFKHYLSSAEFISGYALLQVVPGPVFSFAGYIGALTMRHQGIAGMILGSLMATIGINLPGTLFIFFAYPFWEQLKKYRPVKASLEGIYAASAGLAIAAVFLLWEPVPHTSLNISVAAITFLLLQCTRISAPLIVAAGILAGWLMVNY
ncbi:MAG: chromate efflux transporter [Cytophagales bacterium]|nr:chromate efflux transporter [Bernardetiaceae bacterium]MDW8203670.1 chromate efflux transporter [Cytophagales bacterium]